MCVCVCFLLALQVFSFRSRRSNGRVNGQLARSLLGNVVLLLNQRKDNQVEVLLIIIIHVSRN